MISRGGDRKGWTMRDKIYALAKGNFTYETPGLVITPEKLTMEVVSGTSTGMTFTVANSRGTQLKGFGFTEAQEITFLPVFGGEENELEVEIHAQELVAGSKLTGELILVTDCGETRVPYEFDITAPVLKDDEGEDVRDYFTLQKVAENDPKEGLKLFRDPLFRETFLYRDDDGQLIYDRLVKGNTGLSGMEEFLVAFDKKMPVRFSLKHSGKPLEGPIEYELAGSDIDDVIDVELATWGSVAIRVNVEGDFIETDRRLMWTDEFIDEKGRLEFRIIAGRIHEGMHTGRIVFTSPYEQYEVILSVHSPVGAKERRIGRAKQAAWAMLMRSFLAYEEGRVSKIEFRAFLEKNSSVIERLDTPFQTPLIGYLAWILDSEPRKLKFYRDTENMEVPSLGVDQDVIENYAMVEYIKYLYSERDEDRERLRFLIDGYIGNGYMSDILLVLRLRVDTEFAASEGKCVESLREQLAKGGNSPVLYSELMRRFVTNPDLLNDLDAVNLRTLLYGLKQGLIAPKLADTVTVLSEGRGLPPIDSTSGYGTIRENDPLSHGTGALLMRLLFGMWSTFSEGQSEEERTASKDNDTLRTICALLIRYEKRDRRYFSWYERGVKEMLRLTDLFEYYMYTIDPKREEPLPNTVLSYFQYENHLNETRKAYLYANILKNKEKVPTAYETYEDTIREFVMNQLERERVTADLGYLYRNVLSTDDVDDVLATHLPHVLFRHLLICSTPGIESVTVVHMQTLTDKTYSLDRGRALLDIYTPDYRLFFADRDGNLYVDSIEYTLERFFDGDVYAPLCYPYFEKAIVAMEEEETEDEFGASEDPLAEKEAVYMLHDVQVPDNLLFHLTVRVEKRARLDESEVDVLLRALASNKLRDPFHGKVFVRVYDHIMERVAEEDRDIYLSFLMQYLKTDTIKRGRAGEIAAACIRCGSDFDAEAEELLTRFGTDGCDTQAMEEFVIRRIAALDGEFSDNLVKWALALYENGFRENTILHYLLQYYMGETDTLVRIFRDSLELKRGGSGEEQLREMEGYIRSKPAFYESVRERLLGQILFAGQDASQHTDIFMQYFADGENRVLVKAYLSQLAYDYIVGRKDLDGAVYEKIYRQALYEKDSVMVLAALKKLSGRKSLDDGEREFIARALDYSAAEGIILPFMKDFAGTVTVPYEIRTPVIVQYYSGTSDGVFLFMKNTTTGAYESQPMRQVFDGIFIVPLLLFAGEETTGYIYEEETGKRSKEFELRKKEAATGADSLFEQVNAMIEAKNDDDEKRYEALKKMFIEEQELAKQLFTII